ncbi:MAG: heme exporter protein CcmB [Deltaproteobacteria bacterium]|nr:heme exporter protein CcmB [Deltaproteobacteria bacterium]
MRAIWLLLKKDFAIELRSKETLVLFAGLSILLCLVASFGVGTAALNAETTTRIFPALWWMIFLFSATISLGRGFEYELENAAMEGVLLSGASPTAIYISKVLGSFVLTFALQVLTLILLAGLLDVAVWGNFSTLVVISALIGFGYCALATILVALAGTSRLRSFLLPLILLPLLFPLLFCALELTSVVLIDGGAPWSSVWFTLGIVLVTVYSALGINLYSFVVRE